MGVSITAIEYYLPSRILNNDYLYEKFGLDKKFIEEKLGIAERREALEDESCHTMGHEAALKLFATHQISPESIDLLIVVTQNPDYKLPNVASLLQHSLKLRDKVAALDINLGCSGFVYALAVLKGLMITTGFHRGLIVTSEPYSKVLASDDRSTVPLFGDAAAAVLCDSGANDKLGEFDFGTDGSGAESLIIRTGGSKYPQQSKSSKDNFITMDGRAIYSFMMKRVPQSVAACLTRNNLTFDDIDFFLFHQASKYMLDSLLKRMNIPEQKMVYCLKHCGNTVSSSIPIALKPLISNADNTNKRVLVSGFGVGLSWATGVLYI